MLEKKRKAQKARDSPGLCSTPATEITGGWMGSQRVRVLPGEEWVGVPTACDSSVSHPDQVKPQQNSPRQPDFHFHPDLKSSCRGSGLPSEEKPAVVSKTEGQAGCFQRVKGESKELKGLSGLSK